MEDGPRPRSHALEIILAGLLASCWIAAWVWRGQRDEARDERTRALALLSQTLESCERATQDLADCLALSDELHIRLWYGESIRSRHACDVRNGRELRRTDPRGSVPIGGWSQERRKILQDPSGTR